MRLRCDGIQSAADARRIGGFHQLDQTPSEAFEAIKNVRGWWSQNIDGRTDKLGAVFNYSYRDVHRCKIKILEIVPNKKVVWLVEDNYFSFTEETTEWKGTKIIFEIAKKGDKTELRFTHEGLVPDYECFEMCSTAWGTYINSSLKKLITTGKGAPNPKEKAVTAKQTS